MAFFTGANNVKITGGNFNSIQGNVNLFNQNRHTHNVDSFNTTNRTMIDSGNDSSRRQYGGGLARLGPDDPPRSAPPGRSNAGSAQRGPNGYFPQQPGRHLPPPPPAGASVRSEDSFNHETETHENVFNDNSQEYGAAAPRRDSWMQEPATGSQDFLRDFWGDDDSWNSSYTYGRYGKPPYSGQRRVPPRRGFPPNNPMAQAHQVSTMSAEMAQGFEQLMKMVEKETAPDPEDLPAGGSQNKEDDAMEVEREDTDSDSDDMYEPKPTRQTGGPKPPATIPTGGITTGIAGLSLADNQAAMAATAREAVSSRTKSAPPLDMDPSQQDAQPPALGTVPGPHVPGAQSAAGSSPVDVNAAAAGSSPMHGAGPHEWPPQQPYYPPPNQGHPSNPTSHSPGWGPPPHQQGPHNPYPQYQYPYAPPPQYYPHGHPPPNAFQNYGGGTVENVRSGNTKNVNFKDAFNNNSITEYVSDDDDETPPKAKASRRAEQV